MAGRPWRNSTRFRQRLSSLYASDTARGSRLFQASSAMRTFCAAVSAVKGGRGGRDIRWSPGRPMAARHTSVIHDGPARASRSPTWHAPPQGNRRGVGWSRRVALPLEGREVAVGPVRLAAPVDAERADHVADRGREVQPLVHRVERVVDHDALARNRNAVHADDLLVEPAVDPDADALTVLHERDGMGLHAAELA